eukprot:393070-Alexandrium_andersonii.AAC.1
MGRHGGGLGLAGKGPFNFFVFPGVAWAVGRCWPDVDVHVLAGNSDRIGDPRATAVRNLLSI